LSKNLSERKDRKKKKDQQRKSFRDQEWLPNIKFMRASAVDLSSLAGACPIAIFARFLLFAKCDIATVGG
jgi:hypothetical protein